jgi:NAD(P)H-hydrate epimerase
MSQSLFTAAEMRSAEAAYEGPTLDLMENAGAAVADAVGRRYPDAHRVAVWCGAGANGGDGFVAARVLREAGREAYVVLLAPEDAIEGDAAECLARARAAGVPVVPEDVRGADVVVDALFGTGFSSAPRGEANGWLQALAAVETPVVSVDVPSGVDASTGRVPGPSVQAELTVAFHGLKVGHAVGPGRYRAGDIEIADIGLQGSDTRARLMTQEILQDVPRRGATDTKYTAGFVVAVGGSRGLTGAPVLLSEAAMRAGAGYVRACVPASLEIVFAQRFVEVTTTGVPDEAGLMTADAADVVLEAATHADAVAIGPGLGRSDGTRELVRRLLERLELPVVLDGDGLWALAGHLDWVFARDAPTVLTPHAGELGRLLGKASSWVDANRLEAVEGAADDVGAVVMLKGADTIVSAPGRGTLVCALGSPGLASAGTGDVLTGIVAAFLAKGMEAQLAAVAGAALGGIAAREAAKIHGEAGLLARDVVNALSPVLSHA